MARRVLLLLHLAAGMGWLGVTSTFVVLTSSLLGSRDPATVRAGYVTHETMIVWLARPAAIGTAVTGLVLALISGAARRHLWWMWWVPAKAALLIATVAVTVVVSPPALRHAIDYAEAVGTPEYTNVQHTLVLMALYHVVMISFAAVLAVLKPGQRLRKPNRSSALRVNGPVRLAQLGEDR
ncbi:hypothetical protein [Pseudonocardia adelaidensis]|uniref:DUF2269 domain-containing protein n=1 Tax=Pseudonocardia adelaidensis TaxID=648754 RepID=A0ABP9NNV8_9PSEU